MSERGRTCVCVCIRGTPSIRLGWFRNSSRRPWRAEVRRAIYNRYKGSAIATNEHSESKIGEKRRGEINQDGELAGPQRDSDGGVNLNVL